MVIRNQKDCQQNGQISSPDKRGGGGSRFFCLVALKVFISSQVGFSTGILPPSLLNVLGIGSRELAFKGRIFIQERGGPASCDSDKAKWMSIPLGLQPRDPGVVPTVGFGLCSWSGDAGPRWSLLHVNPKLPVVEASKPMLYQKRFTVQGPAYNAC